MNLLTAYRAAKKSEWKPAIDGKTEKEESKGGKKRAGADIPTNSTRLYYSNGQLHACCVTTPTPVTSETHRGFPCGRARMRVQNTLHRVAKKGWAGSEGVVHEG